MFRITFEREKQNLTKAELSRRSGVSKSTLCRLEKGKIYPYPGWKKKLAKALEVDPEILFEEVKEQKVDLVGRR